MTTCDFSDDGKLLAYAIGYDWTKGAEFEKTHPPMLVKIFVRSPNVSEEVYKPTRRR